MTCYVITISDIKLFHEEFFLNATDKSLLYGSESKLNLTIIEYFYSHGTE